jgi:DsbE subfamily thiol:disulfide oxidoreductase
MAALAILPPSMNRWVKLAALAVAAAAVGQVLLRDAGPEGLSVGRPAPALVLDDLDGRRVDLARYRGQVVAVNFWATWCPPCKEEIPALAEAWRAGRDRCLQVLGVTEESTREDTRAMAGSLGIPYPVLMDPDGEIGRRFGITGYPKTFLVDAEGVVRKVFSGAVSREALEKAVRPLLPARCAAGPP